MNLSLTSLLALSLVGFAAATTSTEPSSKRALRRRSRGGKRKNYYNEKEKCDRSDMVTPWKNIKLTPTNEVAPFVGIPFAFGTADIEILASDINQCDGPTLYLVCITTDIEGFIPKAMHVHRGPIFANGDIVVDFGPLLMGEADPSGCMQITNMNLYDALINEPDMYYVNAHFGATAPTILQSIRGQFVQSYMAELENKQTVAPFNVTIPGASGMAKVSFEAAGSVACFDVFIDGFDPALGHVHNATAGSNGPRIFNYTQVKTGAGEFFGCMTVEELGVTVEQIAMILKNPSMYYFDYHLAEAQPAVFTSIRGQFPMN